MVCLTCRYRGCEDAATSPWNDGNAMSYSPSPNRPPAKAAGAWWGMPVSNGFALVLVCALVLAMWVLD